jgi:ribosome-associated heat shock protein Hsp15
MVELEKHAVHLETQRLDKWLWVSRFFKTRGLAAEAISGGKVHVAGKRVKPARWIRPGPAQWDVIVQGLAKQRLPASKAELLYQETPESQARRTRETARRRDEQLDHARSLGRPTKKERRRIAVLKGKLG